MKTGLTWVLIGLAIVLSVVVFWFDKAPTQPTVQQKGPLFPRWDEKAVGSVDFFYSSNSFVSALKEGAHWNLQAPLRYPANDKLLEEVVSSIRFLTSDQYISGEELTKNKKELADYGIKPFHRSLILQHGTERVEIRLGNQTAGEDEIFFQLIGKDGVYLAPASFSRLIPEEADGWRDSRVVRLDRERVEKVSFKAPAPYGFDLERRQGDAERWNIVRPTPARAESKRVTDLLALFSAWDVIKFVTDNPREFNARYGLERPQAEIEFTFSGMPPAGISSVAGPSGGASSDTNVGVELRNLKVRFGNVDVANTAAAYIGLIDKNSTNVILAKGEFLRNLMFPWQELRTRRLWDIETNEVKEVVFTSSSFDEKEKGGFVLKKGKPGEAWMAEGFGTNTLSGTNSYEADPKVVEWVLDQLAHTEVLEVAKDVVTDFSSYGLTKPFQSIRVEREGLASQQVDFGLGQKPASETEGDQEKVYMRAFGDGNIANESSVSEVTIADAMKFPTDAFQMSVRDVASFTTNDFVQATFQLGARSRVVERGMGGEYKISGFVGKIPEEVVFIFDELVYRLGTLRAESWIYMGENIPPEFEMAEAERSLTIQYLNRGNVRDCQIIFGRLRVDGMQTAAVKRFGKMWVFKFPPVVYEYYGNMLDILMGRDAVEKK